MLRTALCAMLVVQAASVSYVPPKYRSGPAPVIPIQAVGGGEVFLELAISRDGNVTAATTLRDTPPYTDALTSAARGWRFKPAMATLPGAPPDSPLVTVESTVFVAGEFLPPSLYVPTFGTPPKDVGSPNSPSTPLPMISMPPLYPPRARDGGVVLVEVRISSSGDVADARVLSSAPGFDQTALDAARQWKFQPARDGGVEPFAYIAFAFRQPVTGR